MQRLPIVDYAKTELWEKMWNEETPPFWHRADVHPELMKHYGDWTAGRTALRLLIPLCGKSVDMLWLAAKGHTVVGVELVEKAVRDFFTENNLEYEISHEKPHSATEPTLKAYRSTNKAEGKDITIFACDIFQYVRARPREKFDGIWDRGSLVAMCLTKGNRVRNYVQGLLALLAPDGRFFAETCRYDASENEDANTILVNVTEEEMQELFGSCCSLRQVDLRTFDKDPRAIGRPRLAHAMVYHMITFKWVNCSLWVLFNWTALRLSAPKLNHCPLY